MASSVPSRTSVACVTRAILNKFAITSTTHGVLRASMAKGRPKQVFWAIAFLCCLAAVTYNIVAVMTLYFSYPVEVSVILNQIQSNDFPSITVCNINPIRKTAWDELWATSGGHDVTTAEQTTQNIDEPKRRNRRSIAVCDPGWQMYDTSCYSMIPTSEVHLTAKRDCESKDAYLVTIADSAEEAFVDSLRSPYSANIWLGFKRSWFWGAALETTEDVPYDNWEPTQPNGDGNCVVLAPQFSWMWLDRSCNSLYRIICEYYSGTGSCSSGFSNYNDGSCYYVGSSWYPADELEVRCQNVYSESYGVRIGSSNEQQHLVSILPHSEFMIGLTYDIRWYDGTTGWIYTNWDTYDINDQSDHCYMMRLTNNRWRDTSCTDPAQAMPYVCERDVTYITTTTTVEPTTTEPTTTTTEFPTTTTTTTELPTTTTTESPTTTTTESPTTTATEPPTTTTTESPTTTTIESPTTTTTESPTTTTTESPTTTTTESPTTTTTESPTTITTESPTTTTTESPTTTTTESPTTTTTESPTKTTTESPTTTTTVPDSTTTTTAPVKTTTTTTESVTTTTTTTTEQPPRTTTITPKSLATTTTTTEQPATTEQSATNVKPTTTGDPATATTPPPQQPTTKNANDQQTTITIKSPNTEPTGTKPVDIFNCPSTEKVQTTCDMDIPIVAEQSSDVTVADAEVVTKSSVLIPDLSNTDFREQPKRDSFTDMESVIETFAGLEDDVKRRIGHQFDDFVLDCQYGGVSCTSSDFTVFANPVHGNCYVFNSGWNTTLPIKRSYRTGQRHGLTLLLNLNQYEYLAETGDTAGASIVIHQQRIMPFPEDEGIMLLPGRAQSLAIRKVHVERLQYPYGDCKHSAVTSGNVYAQHYPVQYSYMICAKSCLQRRIMEICSCVDPHTPPDKHHKAMPICNSSIIAHAACMDEIDKSLGNGSFVCQCPNPCNSDVFSYMLSSAMWPSDIQKEDVLQQIAQKAGYLLKDRDSYKRNLIRLNIYFEDFIHQSLLEEPAYYWSRFLSSCGGICGLWLGCSFISIFEMMMLLVDLLSARINYRRLHESDKASVSPRPNMELVPGAANILKTMPDDARERYQYVFSVTEVERNLLNNPYFRHRSMIQY